ncbi:hypothetical protein [Congregibacter sp.]|uniref:hypothetical protein n=1 Tax=Congregibacter sp. TaxID=2744308 RepID=UPI003F6A5DB5
MSTETFLLDQFDSLPPRDQFDEDQAFDLIYNDALVVSVPAYEGSEGPEPDPAFVLNLEEPVDGATASGISSLRGWAVSSSGIESIELFVNGQFVQTLTYGGVRTDVESVYPNVPNSRESGFGEIYNFASLGAGEHTVMIRARTSDGQQQDQTSTFTVQAFADDFIDEPGFPAFTAATTQILNEDGTITISPVTLADDTSYRLQLRWSTATQGFEIVSITAID